MIDPSRFLNQCLHAGIDFFSGVPDSLLKSFCAVLSDAAKEDPTRVVHVLAANEGGAVALATGHFLATGRLGLVYMQNSGEGNAVNPLLSLADRAVYGIPMVLLIGWRGEPGVQDEPQHKAQGEVTGPLLDSIRIPFEILPEDESTAFETVRRMVDLSVRMSQPVAILVRKGTFEKYEKRNKAPDLSDFPREQALQELLDALPKEMAVIGTTGMISREIFEIRERNGIRHDSDFLTVGSMGHASQIALGIHLADQTKPIVVIDGDGAALMHTGHFVTIAQRANGSFLHVVVNNAAHDSVGGQETPAGHVDLPAIARACGYDVLPSVSSSGMIHGLVSRLSFSGDKPWFLEIRVRKGARADLGRPTQTPDECKRNFMSFLKG